MLGDQTFKLIILITLKELGYTESLQQFRVERNLLSFQVGRVISEHKERYVVKTETGELDAELIGNLRFSAESRYDFPAVGDWVSVSEYDEHKALIHAIFPRKSIIERKAAGKAIQTQIIATNIDYGIIVQAVDRDFNLNRVERYLTICHASRIKPLVILSKIDLISPSELDSMVEMTRERLKGVPIMQISNKSKLGCDLLLEQIEKGMTYCLLGSSGVGKSSLLNTIAGKDYMKTGDISSSVKKGRHITSHRELIVLDNGGIFIDNPGMREVGIGDVGEGLEMTFDVIGELAQHCKFRDCTHINESGCAVLAAVEKGDIELEILDNFQKMQREKEHFESSLAEKRKKDKQFGKMYKEVMKHKKQRKF